MAVKLRMSRMGRRNSSVLQDQRNRITCPSQWGHPRKTGHYDPIEKDPAKQLVLNLERAKFWLDKGAVPSDTVAEFLLRLGVKTKYIEQRTARRAKARTNVRKKGRPFTKAEKLALQKTAEQKSQPAAQEKKA